MYENHIKRLKIHRYCVIIINGERIKSLPLQMRMEIAMKTALEYGIMGCETIMRTTDASDLKPLGHWHYHQGVFLSGMEHIYALCSKEQLAKYIKDYVDSRIRPDGTIDHYSRDMLDDMQPGILLFRLIDETGDEKYKIALDTIMDHLKNWSCNPDGGYWHRLSGHGQNEMWLDSLYMGCPVQAMYAKRYDKPELFDTVVGQAVLMREKMTDKNNRLLRHAWNYYGAAPWCDPETGLSSVAWGRAIGWYVTAVLDIYQNMPEDHPKRAVLATIEREIIDTLIRYRDRDTYMWHQVVNMPKMPDNWLESSCSCLFTYAMARGARLGILDEKYIERAKESFRGIITHSVDIWRDNLIVERVCVGTGVGEYSHYVNRPTASNDLHGIGVFLLMCGEMAKHGI